MFKKSYVYILFNKKNGTLYTGVTSNLIKRVRQHKKNYDGFTKKYNVNKLAYFEEHTNILFAIKREKTIKNMIRKKKILLIQSMNPNWDDLFYQF